MSKNSALLRPIQVGNLTLKNRIMFPPLTTGYEERDGSIGQRSLAFYERLAKRDIFISFEISFPKSDFLFLTLQR